jgi:hypothetical protein
LHSALGIRAAASTSSRPPHLLQVLTAIVQAAADEGTGAFVVPLRPDRVENVKKVMDKYYNQARGRDGGAVATMLRVF